MDKDSYTYDSAAQQDDGSCLFEGQIVFWYSQAASAGLIADGATALTFYLNSQIVGSSAASVYWTYVVTMAQLQLRKTWGMSKPKLIHLVYRIRQDMNTGVVL